MAYILIDKKAFFFNISLLQTKFSKQKVGLVIKDNAYGHGLEIIANLAKEAGITSVFVKNAEEAQKIAHLFSQITIFYGDYAPLGENINFVMHSLEQLATLPKNTNIELKINIGMNRNGLCESEVIEALNLIKKHSLNLKGVMAHNGFGDDLGSEFYTQKQRFNKIQAEIQEWVHMHHLPMPRFHALSSSGALRSTEIQGDLIRFGIVAYGYLSTSPLLSDMDFKPVLSLYARKICSKALKKGDRVGYGGQGVLEYNSTISSYDVGYGDGLFRCIGNEGLCAANGEKIIGRMSMDTLSILSTQDEICIFNDVREWAKAFKTIPYVILTHLNKDIPRRVKP